MNAHVVSVNISVAKGTPKQAVPEIRIDERGVHGDAHAGAWHRQGRILSQEIVAEFEVGMGRKIQPGEFAENITTAGLNLREVGWRDHLSVGDAQLEVSQIGKECHGDACAIFREVGKCVMPKEGVFCRVLRGGSVRPGSLVVFTPRPLKIAVVTVSDRASRGEYEDRSGPEVESVLRTFFDDRRWHPEIRRRLVPDEADALSLELESAAKDQADVFIATGGTGIGPRDMTPEAVAAFCEKTIPGIMESIRLKYGTEKPNALLSRSIAGVRGRMLVYAIPGSVRAAREYTNEIVKSMEHAILMLHGVDAHS